MNATAATVDELDDRVQMIVCDAGFWPAWAIADEVGPEYGLSDRAVKALTYYAERGWDAVRLDGNDGIDGGRLNGMVTWVRWRPDENEIRLMHATMNGVIHAEARFDMTPKGVAWFAAAVNA